MSGPGASGRTIVLFDIDGTLIRTGRTGSRAMNRAFDDLFGIADAFDGIQMAGRTDRWILADAASRTGVDLGGGNFERFQRRYFARLAEILKQGVCDWNAPGVGQQGATPWRSFADGPGGKPLPVAPGPEILKDLSREASRRPGR